MTENVRFYPEAKSVVVHPLEDSGELRYRLEGFPREIYLEECRLKLAFPAKLGITSESLKNTVRDILIEILNLREFNVEYEGDETVVTIPTRMISDPDILPGEGTVKVPILIKLIKSATAEEEQEEFKCVQEIQLVTNPDGNYSPAPSDDEEEGEGTDNIPPAGLYSGLLAIDYGTSNSVIAVRDPAFASEEVRGQLGKEQWKALCEWLDIWIRDHLCEMEPDQMDMFVQNLTLVIPEAHLPSCGAPRSEVAQGLQRLNDKMRGLLLQELVTRLSNYVQDGGDAKIMKSIAGEVMKGFEAIIDTNSLESQRYFILELDSNVGPAPISSALQVIRAPNTEDPERLLAETKIDMGARVGILLHSATTGALDIRQFILSSKRYFGRNAVIAVVPAESDGQQVQIPADILTKLSYKELFQRAVADIHRRAVEGKFQDAQWPCSVVATFPASYPSALRQLLKQILTELDVREIDARFDEATAAAIYYIWKEIGADPVCGMHGLMARSRKDAAGRAYQNILLYDLGGGTTDIALIQLLYEELDIFKKSENRGNGGSYFRITPRLLGSTGHRYLGGDLITLWLFRYVKSKLADLILIHVTQNNIEPPMDVPLSQLMVDFPEDLMDDVEDSDLPRYRPGSLLEWANQPAQSLQEYNKLNETVIDVVVPTRYEHDSSKIGHFFTLWEITDELKKTLGTPIIDNFGTCMSSDLPNNWPDELELDTGQLFTFLQMTQPWLVDSGLINQEDLLITITQDEMNHIIRATVKQSISLAASLAKARLISENRKDRVDRLILSGLSCNMKVIQETARDVFLQSDGVFEYDPANVQFDRDSAKTAVPLGACIGRYMESVRVDPRNEKTIQLLRDGYDQIQLVIENLFSYLPCRLAYDSLVAMVTIFDQGQGLNARSYWDKKVSVARTSLKDLRPAQEKIWVYRIDFEGAEPQYLGLIDSEAVAQAYGFEDFRKFRENHVIGFEADAELMVRCFYLPKGQKTIQATTYYNSQEGEALPQIISPIGENRKKDGAEHKTNTVIELKEIVDDPIAISQNQHLRFSIQYPDGIEKACTMSGPLHRRDNYEYKVQDQIVARFKLKEDDIDEANLICDEDGQMGMTTHCLFDPEIYAEIEYIAQKMDVQFDPFCGSH